MKLCLSPPNNYDLLSSIHAWIYPDVQPAPEKTGPDWFGRVITIEKTQIPIFISQKTPGSNLDIFYSETSISKELIENKINQILSLKVDISPAIKVIERDSQLSEFVDKISGIRPYLSDSLFEALIKSIIQQQVSYRAANVLTKRMIEHLVSPLNIRGQAVFAFPTSSQLIEMGEQGLRKIGMGFKSEYIMEVCNLIESKELFLEPLMLMSSKSVHKTLTPIRGIGEWTVHALQIAGIGDFSVFPYGDLGIQNLLGRIYNDGKRIKKKQVLEYSAKWGEAGPMVLYFLMCADVLGFLGEISR
ncbi:MAG: hypothetical protein BAJATHORv1_40104 [Candidatus Thorarchaeota archaeon]|nr:MAG: hypothetical protein BAJATHORv1_40104 [Candidatus Thorarchaeota archaeon]